MKTKIHSFMMGFIHGYIPVVLFFLFVFVSPSCQQDEWVGQDELVLKGAPVALTAPEGYPDLFATRTYHPTYKGKPTTWFDQIFNYEHANFETEFMLVVQNGDGNGNNEVMWANININGTLYVSAAEFKKPPLFIYKEGTGLTANNGCTAEIKGKMTSYITLSIYGKKIIP